MEGWLLLAALINTTGEVGENFNIMDALLVNRIFIQPPPRDEQGHDSRIRILPQALIIFAFLSLRCCYSKVRHQAEGATPYFLFYPRS